MVALPARLTVVVAVLGAVGVATVFAPLFFPVTELAMILGWVWMAVLSVRLRSRVASRSVDRAIRHS